MLASVPSSELYVYFTNVEIGLPPGKDYTLSAQGIETIFATNVVGPFVLTNILLPKLESTATQHGNARIVITSSSLHLGCRELKLDLIMSPIPVKHPAAVDSCWRYARRYKYLCYFEFCTDYD
jgi:hypothetical protein